MCSDCFGDPYMASATFKFHVINSLHHFLCNHKIPSNRARQRPTESVQHLFDGSERTENDQTIRRCIHPSALGGVWRSGVPEFACAVLNSALRLGNPCLHQPVRFHGESLSYANLLLAGVCLSDTNACRDLHAFWKIPREAFNSGESRMTREQNERLHA